MYVSERSQKQFKLTLSAYIITPELYQFEAFFDQEMEESCIEEKIIMNIAACKATRVCE